MKLILPLLMSVLLSFPLTGATVAKYPLTIENCGVKETFNHAPSRVVTIGQHETELMLALELKDKIVGTAVWFGPLPDDLKKQGTGLKRLAENAPGFEAVAAQRPELVLAQYSWHVGPQGEVATRQQFEQLGIRTWISPADCTAKTVTATSNGDGARSEPYSIDIILDEISALARIFDVPARGEALKQKLSDRIIAAQQQIHMQPRAPLKVVYWFSSPRLKGDPWIAGSKGAPGWINKTLGLKNIIDSDEEWPAVTWEHIVKSQPDIIVIASMERRLYPADDVAAKKRFLETDPVTREMPAVRQGHIVVVPAMSLNPSLRNVEAVELISQQINAFAPSR
ncbi:ABC transporter substrate-binding protein [Salmonella enterica]|nr:ABC transporter substrate-binding protein [Salmonella enterica]EJZ5967960.1 ABC transporter substrate-binding protein [Salmonella enterica]SUF69386.1 vitamin B12-transporter protein BtuF [Salmonella enterica]SUI19577.1 vitamin B12-transporter protein BtuF [Salmonella enterica subsp. salamae]HCM1930645.1 ABC transporter substrate-binding protein [Salmonella enterica subsp. salamae serovar 51:c:-]